MRKLLVEITSEIIVLFFSCYLHSLCLPAACCVCVCVYSGYSDYSGDSDYSGYSVPRRPVELQAAPHSRPRRQQQRRMKASASWCRSTLWTTASTQSSTRWEHLTSLMTTWTRTAPSFTPAAWWSCSEGVRRAGSPSSRRSCFTRVHR